MSSRLRKNTGTDESVPNRESGIRCESISVDRSVCPRVFPQPARHARAWRYCVYSSLNTGSTSHRISGGKLLLCLGEGQLLQFDSFPNNSFDPFVDASL